MKLIFTIFFAALVVALAESRVQQRRGLTANGAVGVSNEHPYLFLSVPRGRAGSVLHGFEVIEEDDDKTNDELDSNDSNDDDDDNNDDDFGSVRALNGDSFENDDDDDDNDDDDDEEENMKPKNPKTPANLQMILQNAKPTQMMVAKDQAGAIMVPDGIIEIEGQSVIDEKTGKPALLVPQAALDAIPDGSVVALMERSVNGGSDDEEEERANRVIVRRRRRGSRRNVRRRRVNNNNNRNRRRRVSGNRNRRRGGNRRKNVRVVNVAGNNNRRRRNNMRRGSRPVVVQG